MNFGQDRTILGYFIDLYLKKLIMILRRVTSHCSPIFPIVSHCLKNNRPYLTNNEELGLQIWQTCFFRYCFGACQISLDKHALFLYFQVGVESTPPQVAYS